MNVKDFYHRLWHEAMRAWIIAEKDIRIYYAKPPVLMWGVALPLFLFLSWSVGRNQPLGTLIPGMIAITVFFAASSIGPVIIPWEKRNHTFERLLTAPMSLIAILLGKALAGMVFGIAVAALPLLVGIALGAKVAHGLSLVVGVLFSAGAFASLGVLFSTFPGREVGAVMMPATLIRWPLLFISGVFIPLDGLPGWGKALAYLSPLTYAYDIFQGAIGEQSKWSTALDTLALAAFWVAFLGVGLQLHEMGRRQGL